MPDDAAGSPRAGRICVRCHEPVGPGEVAHEYFGGQWMHVTCPDESDGAGGLQRQDGPIVSAERARPDATVTYRRLGVAWFLALVWLVFGLIGVGVAASGGPGNFAFGVILAGVAGWLVSRTLRQAVVLEPQELVVRNLTRTLRIPWSEVESVDPPPPFPTYWRGGLQVHLRSGRTVSATAYSRSAWSGDGFASQVVQDLREHIVTPSSSPTVMAGSTKRSLRRQILSNLGFAVLFLAVTFTQSGYLRTWFLAIGILESCFCAFWVLVWLGRRLEARDAARSDSS